MNPYKPIYFAFKVSTFNTTASSFSFSCRVS